MSKPDFINELGVKWFKEDVATRYAQKLGIHKIAIYRIEHPDGEEKYVAVRKGQIEIAVDTMEQLGIRLDALKILRETVR